MNDEYSNAVLANPPEQIHLLLKSGSSIPFPVYFDNATSKSLVRCDLCQKFLVLGVSKSAVKLDNHRDKKDCKTREERQMRARVIEEENLKVQKLLAEDSESFSGSRKFY